MSGDAVEVARTDALESQALQAQALEAQALEAQALEAAAAIVRDFGAHDRDAYFARFAPDATFVFYTHPVRLESRAEYESVWDGWEREAGFRVHGCTSRNQRVQVVGDVAIFTHEVETELTLDGERSTVHERETIVLRRTADGWAAVHEHLSPAVEAAAA